MQPRNLFAAAIGIALAALPAAAQSVIMKLPLPSPRATVSQRIALTDVTVTYHRPHVAGRKIFGELVPWGQVWRAGANENTVIEITDPVAVEGHTLPRGTYGLHMIPGSDSWTVIFSNNSTSWGSFYYDPKEDALRVTVKPVAGDMHEALTYEFTEVTPESAVMALEWDKVAVPVRITADHDATITSIRNQLRGPARRIWQGYNDPADWCAKNKTDLDEALRWANSSIEIDDRFENEMTKSVVLADMNRETEAAGIRKKALDTGSAMQVFSAGENALVSGHKSDAMEMYKVVAARFPPDWLGHVSKSRLDVAAGDYAGALKEIQAAIETSPDKYKAVLKDFQKHIENKEDINS